MRAVADLRLNLPLDDESGEIISLTSFSLGHELICVLVQTNTVLVVEIW